jgi:hypothetical protein
VDIDGHAYRCRVVDISLSGMVLELDEALVTHKVYRYGTYAIHAGGSRPICLEGRTVWRRGAMQASSFLSLPTDERATLGQMVETAIRRRSDALRLDLAERRDRALAEGHGRRHVSPPRGTPSA